MLGGVMMIGGERFGEWLTGRTLGAGGQGKVFLARRLPAPEFKQVDERLFNRLRGLNTIRPGDKPVLMHLLEAIDFVTGAEVGALKVVHGNHEAKNPNSAEARFRRELSTLKETSDPALVKILDSNEDKRWYVMEYHPRGPLSDHRDIYRGNVEGALRAIRPIVAAVAGLHSNQVIHRDIKPQNIFVADDGRLVLGDFGLVYHDTEEGERLTETYEPVGSWQWMPPWAMSKRVDNIKPSFDVFTLGKVIWAMISGKTILNLHYYMEAEFNLEQLFGDDPSMKTANSLLGKCVVDREENCLENASHLLRAIDVTLGQLALTSRHGASVPTTPNVMFPGAWHLSFKLADGREGSETFRIGDDNVYSVDGRGPIFDTRIVARPDDDSFTFHKRRRDGSGEFVEELEIRGRDERVGSDQHGNQVAYRRLGQ